MQAPERKNCSTTGRPISRQTRFFAPKSIENRKKNCPFNFALHISKFFSPLGIVRSIQIGESACSSLELLLWTDQLQLGLLLLRCLSLTAALTINQASNFMQREGPFSSKAINTEAGV